MENLSAGVTVMYRLSSPSLIGSEHLDHAPGGALLDDAGAFDQKDERRSAPVHRGNLFAVQLDDRIVDTASGERGHEVLDGPDRDPAVADRRAERCVDDVVVDRLDRPSRAGRPVGAAEDDAGARRRRAQLHAHLAVAVYANTGTVNGRLEGLLWDHCCTGASRPLWPFTLDRRRPRSCRVRHGRRHVRQPDPTQPRRESAA